MRRVLTIALVMLCALTGTPRTAHAWFGVDFMEWLNDMSGPGPFHVFGIEATLACWGHVGTIKKATPTDVLLMTRVSAPAATAPRLQQDSTLTTLTLPPELVEQLGALGLDLNKKYFYFTQEGDIAIDNSSSKFSRLRSPFLTASAAFACNQPADSSRQSVVDLHRQTLLLGVLVNYLFSPMNHLEYADVPPDGDTPNIHALLALGTADLEVNPYVSFGAGAGTMSFLSRSRYKTFHEPALQFRVGLRPLKHLDGGLPRTGPRRATLAEEIDDVPFQRAFKRLSSIRFVIGYTWLPTSSGLTSEDFGALPGWSAKRDEHILTVNFSLDLSRVRKWRDHRADGVALGERARY